MKKEVKKSSEQPKVFLNGMNLLKKEDLEIVEVDLGKDEFVYVRQMTGKERDELEQSLTREYRNEKTGEIDFKQDLSNFRAKLAVKVLCDAEGKNLLSAKNVGLLSENMSAYRLELIVEVASKINKITQSAREGQEKN